MATLAWTALAGLGIVSYALAARPLTAAAAQEAGGVAQSEAAEIEALRERLGQAQDLEAELRAQLRQANAEFRYELRAIEAELVSVRKEAATLQGDLHRRIEALDSELARLLGTSVGAAAAVDEEIVTENSADDPGLVDDPGTADDLPYDAATAPGPAGDAGPADDAMKVEAAVRRWASAWREQRVEAFVALYSADFVPPEEANRAVWEARRRQQIDKAAFIRLDLSSLVVEVQNDRATVSFLQSYESDTYSDIVIKILSLVAEEDGWRIVSERALPQ